MTVHCRTAPGEGLPRAFQTAAAWGAVQHISTITVAFGVMSIKSVLIGDEEFAANWDQFLDSTAESLHGARFAAVH